MRVFLAGATGTLGQPTVRALLAAGHDVRALARDAARAAILRDSGVEPVVADLFDAHAMRAVVEGSDAVLHLATRIPPLASMRRRAAWRDNDRVRRDGARVLVDAALAGGVRVYLQESVTFLYADGGARWLDETAPTELVWPLVSVADAERETARFRETDRAAIVLRFAAFYAPYAPSTRDTIRLARRRLFAVAGTGANYLSAIHVDDAAAAVAAALALPSGIYNVCDDEPLPMREHVTALASAFGFSAPLRVPVVLARLLLGPGGAVLLRSQRVANGTLKRMSGWRPAYPSAREGWKAIARASQPAP